MSPGFITSRLQVGCHKFATKIRACATFGGDFELKIPRMREFSSQICDNQPANIDSRVNGIGNMHQGHFASVSTPEVNQVQRALWREIQDLHLSMATGLPAVNDVEPFSPGTG